MVYGAIAVIFVPPVRRWFHGHFDAVKAHIEAENAHLHRKLDHVILNSQVDPQ